MLSLDLPLTLTLTLGLRLMKREDFLVVQEYKRRNHALLLKMDFKDSAFLLHFDEKKEKDSGRKLNHLPPPRGPRLSPSRVAILFSQPNCFLIFDSSFLRNIYEHQTKDEKKAST